MYSYGYDRENAEKVYEIQRLRAFEMLWGTACGVVAVYKTGPVRHEISSTYALFRKPWMRVPIPLAVFAFAYKVGTALPHRLGSKYLTKQGITHESYKEESDVVSRFRLFENNAYAESSVEANIINYLNTYGVEAQTKPEVIASL